LQTKFTKIYCQMPEDISNENDVGDDIGKLISASHFFKTMKTTTNENIYRKQWNKSRFNQHPYKVNKVIFENDDQH